MSDVLVAPRSLGQAWGVKSATSYQKPVSNGTYGVRVGLPQARPNYGGYRADGFNRFANTPGASAPARAQQLSPTQANPAISNGLRPQVPNRNPVKTPAPRPTATNPLSRIPQNARAGAAASAALTGLSLYGNIQQGQGPFEAVSGALTQPFTGVAGQLSGGLLAGPLNLGNGYAAALSGADSAAIGEATNRFNDSLGADSVTDRLNNLLTAPGRALDNFFGFGKQGNEGGPRGDYSTPTLPFTGGQSQGVWYHYTLERTYYFNPNDGCNSWDAGGVQYRKPQDNGKSHTLTYSNQSGVGPLSVDTSDHICGRIVNVPTDIVRADGQPDTGGDPPPVDAPATSPSAPNGGPVILPNDGNEGQGEPPVMNPYVAAPLALAGAAAAGGIAGALAPGNLTGPGPSRATAPAKPNTPPKSPGLPSKDPKKGGGGGGPSGNQPPTKKNNKCGCNKGILDGVKNLLTGNVGQGAQLGLLGKIDATTTVTRATAVANATQLGAIATKLQTMQAFAEKAWKNTHLDKVINLLTLVTVLHNAAMMSRNVGETLGYLVSNSLAVIGVKDEDGSDLDISGMIGSGISDFIKSVVGADVYDDVRTSWQKANRVLQAGSNIIWTLRNINDAKADILEWTAENTGKIGNALKRYGVVGERAYPWMAERARVQDAYRNKLNGLFERLESIEDTADSLSVVTSNVREIQEEVGELREARDRFKGAVRDLGPEAAPTASPENEPIATAESQAETASASPDVAITDAAKGEADATT